MVIALLKSEHSPSPPASPEELFDTKLRVRYAETDQMGVVYYANYLIGGGPSGGNVWSGASHIPQFDGMGNFLGYYSETIGQILARAKSHEYLTCGSDYGSGWPCMYPRYPMP